MPSFNFTPVKITKVKSHAESSSKYNIIVPNTEGTIFITLEGKYIVVIGDDKYDIASESYSCKGVSEIYYQDLHDGKIRERYTRPEKDRNDTDRDLYLPFTAGCSVKGNIVRYKAGNCILFKIKKVYLDFNCEISRKAIKFYRDNYDKIRRNMEANFINEYNRKDYVVNE